MNQIYAPTVIFSKKDTVYGPCYAPLNPHAKWLAELAKAPELSADDLAIVRDKLGYRTEIQP